MGGERETNITSRSATLGSGDQTIRVHENAGKVHFHDDKKNLKVEAPAATVWQGWRDIRTRKAKSWNFEDVEHGTKVVISETSMVDDTRNISITVTEAQKHGPEFVAFDKFANP
jgi:hypothetical protein